MTYNPLKIWIASEIVDSIIWDSMTNKQKRIHLVNIWIPIIILAICFTLITQIWWGV